MKADFWLEKWEKNEIAFHGRAVNPLLAKYLKLLSLTKGARVFIPLCGKTLDIAWLLSQGYRVAGAELSEMAIQQLFKELDVQPKISEVGSLKHYSAEGIDIFVGNIFELTGTMLGTIDAVYDRAALVALPEEMRRRYTAHLMQITNASPQLLICYEYDQTLVDGPPFSISATEITQHYAGRYALDLVESVEVAGGLRGKHSAKEHVWSLKPLS